MTCSSETDFILCDDIISCVTSNCSGRACKLLANFVQLVQIPGIYRQLNPNMLNHCNAEEMEYLKINEIRLQ
jgi:hypothetical protein